ncbi:MAG: hypothetical protein ACOY3D_00660, partial [Candidatus Omnitrophota bacterium]
MANKRLFIAVALAAIMILSFVVAGDKLTAADTQVNPQDAVLAKLDEIVANQQKILTRLDALEENLIHEI